MWVVINVGRTGKNFQAAVLRSGNIFCPSSDPCATDLFQYQCPCGLVSIILTHVSVLYCMYTCNKYYVLLCLCER